MSAHYDSILFRVAEEILGSLAFLFPLITAEERKNDKYVFMWGATIAFTGPFSGQLIILISEKILPELVQNMLGLESGTEISLALQHDALKELLSIVCGNLLPAFAGRQALFNLGVPKIVSPEDYNALVRDKRPTSQATLPLENGEADFTLFIEEGSLPPNRLLLE